MSDKNYRSLDSFYKEKFGKKVFKISLDAGFTCPNKDGSKGLGGCIFCNGSVAIGDKKKNLKTQFEEVKKTLHEKWPDAGYIAFLEANTNTYGNLSELKKIYEEVLGYDGVLGLAIATRCDAFTEEIYDYLEELSKKTYLSIELGLQSSFDESLKYLNRGHTREEFAECVKNLRKRNIEVVVHIINGIPFETPNMMVETIRFINDLDVQGVKFHMLYIEEGTKLAQMYESKSFPLLTQEEYIEVLGKQITVLNKNIVIHRLLSGPDNQKLIEPKWLLGKFRNLNAIETYLKENNIIQGTRKMKNKFFIKNS